MPTVPVLPAEDVSSLFNHAALMMEIGAAVLLAAFFVVVRRQLRPQAYFALWERAWVALAFSLVALLARQLAGMPPLLALSAFLVGKLAFFGLLLLGTLAYQRPGRPLPVALTTAALAFLGVITAWLSATPDTAVGWQSSFAMVLCAASAWRFQTLPRGRKTLGTRATSIALLTYALSCALVGVAAMATPWSPWTGNQAYVDTLIVGGLGFGMVLLVMEEARHIAQQSEARLQTLIASTTDALLLLDAHLRVQAANPAAERLFDVPEATMLGCDLLSLVEVNDAAALHDAIMRFATGGGSDFRVGESEPMLARRGAGAPVRVDGALWRLPGDRGEMAAILRDVTVREELRTRQATQAKTDAVRQLAAGIAHDFSNLLTTISTTSHLLLGEFDGDERVRDAVTEIARATTSAGRLARDLLTLSGRQSLQPTLLDVNTAVRTLERVIRERLPAGVTADFRYAVDAGRVRVDTVRFGDALLVMAQNAGEAMERTGGRILVATARGERAADAHAAGVDERAEYAYISVHDTGFGLSVEARTHVFEPFYTTKGAGRGLGLPTALGFAQQSGGWLSVQSSPAGTIVRLGFPLAQEEELPVRGATVAGVPSTTPAPERYALLAEDDDTVRRVVRLVLLREGFKVLEAANGVAALDVWQATRPTLSVLIADVEMPLMGGPELAARLLQLHPGVRIILMSGYVADDAVRAAIPAAEVAFLQKPFDVDELLRVVRNERDYL